MNRYTVPTVPTVTLSAVREEWTWVGEEEFPDEESGWVEIHNPWGSLKFDERGDEVFTITEAAEIAKDFSGAIRCHYTDLAECEPDQDYRTGTYRRVTLFMDGPGAQAAAVLAGLVA